MKEAITELPYSGEEVEVKISDIEPGPKNDKTMRKDSNPVSLTESSVDCDEVTVTPLVEVIDKEGTGERKNSQLRSQQMAWMLPQGKSRNTTG